MLWIRARLRARLRRSTKNIKLFLTPFIILPTVFHLLHKIATIAFGCVEGQTREEDPFVFLSNVIARDLVLDESIN